MCGTWQEVGKLYSDWEDAQYIEYFRMSKGLFYTVCSMYSHFIRKQHTTFRQCIHLNKRMAMCLYWLTHALSYAALAAFLYGVGRSTAAIVVHQCIDALRLHMVSSSIRFSEGQELKQVIRDFQALCHLPLCRSIEWNFNENNRTGGVGRQLLLLEAFTFNYSAGMC